MAEENKASISFKDTLNLPRTDLPIRPNAAIDDPAMIVRWETSGLYDKAFVLNEGAQSYILHVGPPYANGHTHLGHAYDSILKDIITKSYRMAGYHVPVTPGWDCHGLPIEIKVAQTSQPLSRLEFKKACRTYAEHWVNIQRGEFKRLGVVMDWDHPYITMAPTYEASVVRAFGELLKGGYIERKNKAVAWCYSCKTVLAAAEIEYHDRKDPSIYVRFPFEKSVSAHYFPEAQGDNVSLLIWTTTPWTLPLNRAVVLKDKAEYVLARLKDHLIVLGCATLPLVEKMVGAQATVIKTFSAEYLAGARVQHPFDLTRTVPLIFDDSVGLDEGTACVHCAPGCGPVDYELGVKNNLEIYSPLTPDGRYAEGVVPEHFKGMAITDAQGVVISQLAQEGRLFHKASITHSYPHCWRCRNGLMFRATQQWFFNLQHNAIKQRVIDELPSIKFMPPQGQNFLRATIESRWEWCLSRQKIWGTPIPALLCTSCGQAYCAPAFIESVAKAIEHEGIEYWERVTVEELMRDKNISCASCHSTSFEKEQDILDVWFDSGVSHYAVLYNNPALQFPADLYCEGIDQHRGWFQSSLLTAAVLEKSIPTKGIMTHGFTVDEKGQKMSKSLGNVILPQDIITKLGTDGLRLWVASIGHEGDAVVSEKLIANVGEVLRKIRNTARFLIANLYDFDGEYDRLPIEELLLIDRGILAQLYELNESVIADYHAGNLTKVFHALTEFCTVHLSSWYLDIIKDRLYVEKPRGRLRRSAQTTCWYLLDTLTRLMAPIMSFTAEQLSDLYQKNKPDSVHLQRFAALPKMGEFMASRAGGDVLDTPLSLGGHGMTQSALDRASYLEYQARIWEYLREIRALVLKAIEREREKGLIKHSLEARVTLFADPQGRDYELLERFIAELRESGETLEQFLKEFLIVSQVEVRTHAQGLCETAHPGWFVLVEHARGVKCPRCWNWDETTHEHNLCGRCSSIVDKK